jgi:hypothetical protein
MIPLMTSRFLPGFTRRRFIGIVASTDAHCSSVSQNRFDIALLRFEDGGNFVTDGQVKTGVSAALS